MSISDFIDAKPIDLVMRFVKQQGWFLHSNNINELIADVPGRWGQHQLHIEWFESEETLDVSCNLDITFDKSLLRTLAL